MELYTTNRLTDTTLKKFNKQNDKNSTIELIPGCLGCYIDMYDGHTSSGLTLTASEMRGLAEELIFLSGVQSTLEEAKSE